MSVTKAVAKTSKKLPVVLIKPKYTSHNYLNKVRFAFATLSGRGQQKKVKAKHSLVSCKDHILDILMSSRTNAARPTDPKYSKDWKIDETKCYLLCGYTKPHFTKVKYLINYFEERAGWPKSVLLPTSEKNMYLFSGTKRWMAAPPLLSFLTLLLRLGNYQEVSKKLTRSLDIKTIESLKRISLKNQDVSHFRLLELIDSFELIKLIMKHYRSIFFSGKENYPKGSTKAITYHGLGGIYEFCKAYQMLEGIGGPSDRYVNTLNLKWILRLSNLKEKINKKRKD